MASADPIPVEIDQDLADLIPGYMRNTRSAIEQILERCAAQAFEDVQRLGHNLKGSGGGYGFPEITSFGQKIEAAAKARDQAALKQHAAALGQYLDRVVIRFV